MPELDLTLDRRRLEALRHGAVLVTSPAAVFRIGGSGALACLQGLFTNDLLAPGDGSLVYGAMLTPKGMILTDAWVLRWGDTLTMIVPCEGRARAQEIFARALPPRVARATDLTDELRVTWLLGERGFQTLAKSGIGAPEGAGRVMGAGGTVLVGLAPEAAPFAALLVGPVPAVEPLAHQLTTAGARRGDELDRQAARILDGWPGLGAEIDDRTLPQEVRYDEIGGVSYTKGCYTGQETVARLHFRGHTNRELRGLRWLGAAPVLGSNGPDSGREVRIGEREVGTVRSTLTVDGHTMGLALIRRETAVGTDVVAAGQPATVTALPFGDEQDA